MHFRHVFTEMCYSKKNALVDARLKIPLILSMYFGCCILQCLKITQRVSFWNIALSEALNSSKKCLSMCRDRQVGCSQELFRVLIGH